MRREVVITGLGLVTGLGKGADALWEGMLTGKCALSRVRQFDASAFPMHFASEVREWFSIRDFVPKSYRKATKVMCRDIELAVAAAALAVGDGNLATKATSEDEQAPATYAPGRVGCQIGAGLIVAEINELAAAFAKARSADGSFDYSKWGTQGMQELTPLWLLKYLPNMLACHVTILHDCRGPSNTITCGEASGALSIGESMRVIERGDADLCFSGGGESKINPLGYLRQYHTGMMATTQMEEDAGGIVQPFAEGARGSLPGEGAAILMLESKETALARQARIRAELAGFGASQTPALALNGPAVGMRTAALSAAIHSALRDAGITAEDIDAVLPMGSGCPAFDKAEAGALAEVFGLRQGTIPVILTKPNIGLCAAASSALDIAVGAMCVQHQTLPARLGGAKASMGLDVEARGQRDAKINHLLVFGSSLGGQNYALVLRRPGAGGGGR